MSTHQDWEKARFVQRKAAIEAANAAIRGDENLARQWLAQYSEADNEMKRIAAELRIEDTVEESMRDIDEQLDREFRRPE